MPLTSYPNGVTARALSAATTAAGSGDIDCLRLFTAGTVSASGPAIFTNTVTVGSATQLIGGYSIFTVTFQSTSVLEQKSVVIGFPSCSLDAVYQTVSSTSALVAAYTVQVGSAGAVSVATVSNATQSVGVINSLTTTAVTFDGTASALVCIRSAQVTAGETVLALVVRRSA